MEIIMSTVAREYAEALFLIACEENAEKEIGDSLTSICKIFDGSPEYKELLSSPAVPVVERAAVIDEAFRGSMPEHTVSFLQLLSEKGRMELIDECAEEYRKLAENRRARTEATVISAVPLTETETAALKAKLEEMSGKTVTLTLRVDADIMGGVIVEYDGKVMDGSVRTRLRELKEAIQV